MSRSNVAEILCMIAAKLDDREINKLIDSSDLLPQDELLIHVMRNVTGDNLEVAKQTIDKLISEHPDFASKTMLAFREQIVLGLESKRTIEE